MSYLTKENVQEIYPLSPIQQGMLFHTLMEPEASPYQEQGVYRLLGAVDAGLFERAWEVLVGRHPILRTVFYQGKKQPAQIVLERRPHPVVVRDLSGLEETHRRSAMVRLLTDDARRPLSVSKGPLMRLILVRTEEDRSWFVWTLNHLIIDGWSFQLLLDDLTRVYRALAAGEEPPAPLFPPYREYIAWLGRQDQEAAREHWRRHLAGFTTPTPLPADRRPAPREHRDTVWKGTALSAEASRALEELARGQRLTASVVMQAAWALLLCRYSGESEVVFGLTVSGRPADLPGSERMVGPFINTLPVRVRTAEEMSLRDLLHGLQQQLLDLTHYEYLPLVDVQAVAEVPSPQRLFESILVFHNQAAPGEGSDAAADGGGFRISLDNEGLGRAGTSYDLALEVQAAGEVVLQMAYTPQVFDRGTIERLLESLAALLEAFPRSLDRPLGEITALPPAHERFLREECNRTGDAPAPDRLAHQLVEEQAAARPDAVAVTHGESWVSYGELDRRADRLARQLRSAGAGPEVAVAVLGQRSPGMLATILAIAKVGAFYLPLEPDHPDARLQAILGDARPPLLLIDGSAAARAAGLVGPLSPPPELLRWDGSPGGPDLPDPASTGEAPELAAEGPAAPLGLANVFYTSGSTGVPKGAMVHHRGMLNHLWAKVKLLGLGEGSAVAQNASQGFDISVWQFLAPLVAGGRTVIYGEEAVADAESFLDRAEADGITVLETVPTLLELMLAGVSTATRLPHLTHLISNAETLPVPLARGWLERFPAVPILNTYGATECSDDVTHQVFTEPPPASALRVGVGRPIAGMRVDVLDRRGEPVPVGCPGQLAFAGVGLGRGYLGDAAKTAATWVPDGRGGKAAGRLYLTGDLGRWTAAAHLEFLGRLDHQVKVRGHRIELGEVEAALARHPDVRQQVVVVRPDARGANRLVAYTVSRRALEPAALRELLRRHLPAYMVPEDFVPLPALPLTANGKVDREALPEPEEAGGARGFVAPRGEVEEKLAAIWGEVLEVDRVGAHDDFFELGGHSLKTIQVRSRLKAELGVALPLRTLFDYPTLEELAAAVEEQRGSGRGGEEIPRQPAAEHYPLSHAQRRLWYLQAVAPERVGYNMPSLFRIAGPFDPAAFRRALEILFERHASLRTSFTVRDGEPVQRIEAPGEVRLEVEDLSGLAEAEGEARRLEALRRDILTPFELDRPPVRMRLLRLAPELHLFIWVLHHIITDAWSWALLEGELEAVYRSVREEGANPLVPLPIAYVDYAAWHNGLLEGERRQEMEGYWLRELEGELPALELPTDHPRPAVKAYRSKQLPLQLAPGVGEGLQQLAQQEAATLFMVFLAATQSYLFRLSGQTDFLVGTVVAGRERVEVEGVVGFFVNTVALRARPSAAVAFLPYLRAVREKVLSAFAHQDYPFNLLIEKLNPVREASQTPMLSTLFLLNEAPPAAGAAPALEPVPVPAELSTGGVAGDFDLVVNFFVHDGAIEGFLTHDEELFDATTGLRLKAWLQNLLASAAADPERALGELALMGRPERQQILLECNDRSAALGAALDWSGSSVPQLFAAGAALHPDRVAVSQQGRHLTYGELAALADRLRRHLQGLGVGPEVRVGVMVHRRSEMLAALLGVSAAGGAYVPLDPAFPRARRALMMEDSGLEVVITEGELAAELPDTSARVVRLEEVAGSPPEDSPAPGVPAGALEAAPVAPEQLAYVLYTSGSTGRPKGVEIPHRALIQLLAAVVEPLGLTAADTLLAVTSLSFDIAGLELFLPLLVGARVELASGETVADAAALRRRVECARPTVMQGTPAAWQMLLTAGWSPPGALRILSAGEVLHPALAARLSAGGAPLWNLYGPTEATIYASFEAVRGGGDGAAVSIGRPIHHTQTYLLDRRLRPVPLGVGGELFIGGEMVGRGYGGLPALTASRFLPDPFSTSPGGRLYRTGDEARLGADGRLWFHGRLDHQVKVRGYRIELGEIEARLAEHQQIRECAVGVFGMTENERDLVAHVVAEGPASLRMPELRAFLGERLPAYMIPAHFVALGELPRLPNGKLDRKSLPPPEGSRRGKALQVPRDGIEEAMVEIWRQTLGVDAVGIGESFFELGGHSLKAAALMSRIEERFGESLPVSALLQGPTVAALSGLIRGRQTGSATAAGAGSLVPLHRVEAPAHPPLFLVHPHAGEVFPYRTLAALLPADRPLYALRSRGLGPGEGEPLESIEEMAAHYLEEIRRVQPSGPYRLGGWSFGGVVAFEMARQLEAAGEAADHLILIDVMAEWPAREGPLPLPVLGQLFFGVEEAAFDGQGEEEMLQTILDRGQGELLLPGTSPARLEQLLGVLRANTVALGRHRVAGRVASHIHLLRAEEGSHVPDPDAWRRRTRGPFGVIPVAGDHHDLFKPPALQQLAAAVAEALHGTPGEGVPTKEAPEAMELGVSQP